MKQYRYTLLLLFLVMGMTSGQPMNSLSSGYEIGAHYKFELFNEDIYEGELIEVVQGEYVTLKVSLGSKIRILEKDIKHFEKTRKLHQKMKFSHAWFGGGYTTFIGMSRNWFSGSHLNVALPLAYDITEHITVGIDFTTYWLSEIDMDGNTLAYRTALNFGWRINREKMFSHHIYFNPGILINRIDDIQTIKMDGLKSYDLCLNIRYEFGFRYAAVNDKTVLLDPAMALLMPYVEYSVLPFNGLHFISVGAVLRTYMF